MDLGVPALWIADAARIPFSMLVVFASAKLLSEIFERLRQPGIVGEILAGILIGPSVLGWIAPGDVLSALADLGAMFLLFRVGLEVKSSELLKVSGTAAVVAILGVISTLTLVWAVLSWSHTAQNEALFLAAALVATSVGITAQVLAARGLLELTASRIILAAAVIDDVIGLIVLAVVTSVAQSRWNLGELLLTAGLAIGFTIVVAVWGAKALGAIAPRVEERLRVAESQFVLALVLMFLFALLAVYSGIAAIVGAFLAGMALSEHTGPRVRDLTQGVSNFLVPFFLANIGLYVNLSAVSSWPVVRLTLVLVLAVVISKVAGCGLGAMRLGRQNAVRVGVGMIPRGEVCVAVARVGLGMGILGAGSYSMVVLTAVAAAVLAPPLLYLVFPKTPAAAEGSEEVYRLG